MKNRQAKVITNAFTACHAQLITRGHEVNLFILDDECFNELKLIITKAGGLFELILPHTNRCNAAERAIRTFRNHLLRGLATYDPENPIEEWDRFVHQSELALNLLSTSRVILSY